MKKLLLILLWFLIFIVPTYWEWNICDLTGEPLNVRQNIYSTGWYVITRQVTNSYNIYRTYNIKNCDTISTEYLNIGFNYPATYFFHYQSQHIDIYTAFTQWIQDPSKVYEIILVNKNTWIILTSTFYSADKPSYYRVMDGWLWIWTDYQDNYWYLISLTGATYQTNIISPWNLKSPNSYYYDCNYLGTTTSWNTSICMYKKADNTGIFYTGNDNTDYTFINDNWVLNWTSHNMIDKILLWLYWSNNFWIFSYNKIDWEWDENYSNTGRVISSVYASWWIIYNASIDVPYSQGWDFPEYDFNIWGRPLIWTDYTTLISYYVRNWTLYNNNEWALITALPNYQGGWNNGTWSTGTWSTGTGEINIWLDFTCDTNNDGEVGIAESIVCPITLIKQLFLKIWQWLSNIYDFWNKLKELSPNISFNFITKANANDDVNAIFETMSNKSPLILPQMEIWKNIILYWIILILIIIWIFILLNKKD